MRDRSELLAARPGLAEPAAPGLVRIKGTFSLRSIRATDMARTLRQRASAGMTVDCRDLPGENHQSMLVAGLSAVLRFASDGVEETD